MERTPRGMKSTKYMQTKEIFVVYIPKKSVRRCFTRMFQDELECDAWMISNEDEVLKVVEMRVRETFTAYYEPEERSE
jgi:hypothetical protein